MTVEAQEKLLNSIQTKLTDSESFQKKLADAVEKRISTRKKNLFVSIARNIFSALGIVITILLSAAQVFDTPKLWLRHIFNWFL